MPGDYTKTQRGGYVGGDWGPAEQLTESGAAVTMTGRCAVINIPGSSFNPVVTVTHTKVKSTACIMVTLESSGAPRRISIDNVADGSFDIDTSSTVTGDDIHVFIVSYS